MTEPKDALDVVAGALAAWVKEAFQSLIVPIKTTHSYSTRISDKERAVAYKLVDEQYPFGGEITVGMFQTNGDVLEVHQWCTKYDYSTDPTANMRVRRGYEPIGGGAALCLGDPRSLPVAMDRIMDIGMDYCRMLYRKSIKAKRKHLKPLVSEMMEIFVQERRRCKARGYQLETE